MANDTNRRSYTYDSSLLMKDAGLVAASAAATVASAAKVLDVGATAYLQGVLVLDVGAIEVATTDEKYVVIVQGSNSSSFASGIENLAALDLGAAATGRYNGAQISTVGRYELLFQNVNNDTLYRYIRVYTFVSGTIATGINYTAFISTPLKA